MPELDELDTPYPAVDVQIRYRVPPVTVRSRWLRRMRAVRPGMRRSVYRSGRPGSPTNDDNDLFASARHCLGGVGGTCCVQSHKSLNAAMDQAGARLAMLTADDGLIEAVDEL